MRNKQKEQKQYNVQFIAETIKAVLIQYENKFGITQQSWVPMSQVHYIDKQSGVIRITPFIANKLNLV